MAQLSNNPPSDKPPSVAYTTGSAIRGEKITAQFRRMSKVTITRGSSAHNIQRTTIEGSVLCVIDRPLNYLRDMPK
jgi:hypothetical protein